MTLTDRAALVTGAARGIGEAIATRLGRHGMRVVVNDVDAHGAERVAQAIVKAGGVALAIAGDVSVESDVSRIVSVCSDAFGGLYALVNNAGVDVSGPPREMDRRKWSRVLDVDLWGPMLLVREAENLLAASGGAVVNIGSNHAIATVAHRSAYAAAKSGLVGLTRALAIDLGPRGIRVNAVLPGYIQTPIWALWLNKAPDPEALLNRIAKRHPVRRLGQPDDVAGVVAFLLSNDAAFITGACVVVDGGYSCLLEPPHE